MIMVNQDFGAGAVTLASERVFEYTDDEIQNICKKGTFPDFNKLTSLPCLFMQEGTDDQLAYVGHVTRVRTVGTNYSIEHFLDRDLKPITNSAIYERRIAYGIIQNFEFSRNHWAVKDVDLYRLLLTHSYPSRQTPKVFAIPPSESVQPDLLSVMMPFDAGFKPVHKAIRDYAKTVGFQCKRADDIWNHDAIIQDVVELIDKSRIVICDCSNRNANVFYEAGIAHTLGRDVILITQNAEDIPFDLRHLRYIKYLNNAEGHRNLIISIKERVSTIVERAT